MDPSDLLEHYRDAPEPEDCEHVPVLRGGGKSGGTVVSLWQCAECGLSIVKEHKQTGDGDVLFPGWNAPDPPGMLERVRDRFG